MEQEKKRLFFGVEIDAPWPAIWPKGRIMQQRHLTLAFLGSLHFSSIKETLSGIPHPKTCVGPRGWFDTCLLLPQQNPHVVAWHVHWLDLSLAFFQKELSTWLTKKQISLDKRDWLSHVTVCRDPLEIDKWTESFTPLPCFATALHLYESLKGSHYQPLWSYPFTLPFEEIEHTADIAFHIFGETLKDLYASAFIALAFKDPSLLYYWEENPSIDSLDDIVILLNTVISKADRMNGTPFKAVSFHGEIDQVQNNLLQWEMIVDI